MTPTEKPKRMIILSPPQWFTGVVAILYLTFLLAALPAARAFAASHAQAAGPDDASRATATAQMSEIRATATAQMIQATATAQARMSEVRAAAQASGALATASAEPESPAAPCPLLALLLVGAVGGLAGGGVTLIWAERRRAHNRETRQ